MEETLSSGEGGGARSSGGQWLGFLPKHIHKQVEGCVQNCYQSVAIHLKYVVLVLL